MNRLPPEVKLPFLDRQAAGRLLAGRLSHLKLKDPIVLALPRGGIPLAVEVAKTLHAPMDLLLVRKIGAPSQPELALAALVDGNPPIVVMDAPVQEMLQVTPQWIEKAVQREMLEIARRRQVYLRGREPQAIKGRPVIVVDDGIATGTTVRAALAGLKQGGASRVVLAIPVAPRETIVGLIPEVDDLLCLAQPEPFHAIGQHYLDFHQLSDAEVLKLLAEVEDSPHQAGHR